MRRRGTRAVCAVQAGTGLATVGCARLVAARIGGAAGTPAWLAPLIAVLGVRQIAQAALVYTVDDPLLLRAGAAVDALHATSMLPVLLAPRYRVAAAMSAALATAAAAAEVAVAERTS